MSFMGKLAEYALFCLFKNVTVIYRHHRDELWDELQHWLGANIGAGSEREQMCESC